MSWAIPETNAELREQYSATLERAITFYLGERRPQHFSQNIWAVAQSSWDRSENPRAMLASVAVEACHSLLPFWGEIPKDAPTEESIRRFLDRHYYEQRLEELNVAISVAEASAREEGIRDEPNLIELRTAYQTVEKTYYQWLGFGDLDEEGETEADGPAPVLAGPRPPQKGPSEGRTFEEALEPPRDFG